MHEHTNLAARLMREGYPVMLSNKVDPFAASNYKMTLPHLRLFKAKGIPVAFQTKGGKGIEEALFLSCSRFLRVATFEAIIARWLSVRCRLCKLWEVTNASACSPVNSEKFPEIRKKGTFFNQHWIALKCRYATAYPNRQQPRAYTCRYFHSTRNRLPGQSNSPKPSRFQRVEGEEVFPIHQDRQAGFSRPRPGEEST